ERAEDALRLARIRHVVLEAQRQGVGSDLENRMEYDCGAAALESHRRGERPTGLPGTCAGREAKRFACDLDRVLADGEHAFVAPRSRLEHEQGDERRSHYRGAPPAQTFPGRRGLSGLERCEEGAHANVGTPSTRVLMRS